MLTGDTMEKIIFTTFTDPMMGLSYEQEPVYEKLAAHFGDRLVFHYVMSGLVRDVSDFMVPEEKALPAEEGIRLYNRRLARIYKGEEAIGGLPCSAFFIQRPGSRLSANLYHLIGNGLPAIKRIFFAAPLNRNHHFPLDKFYTRPHEYAKIGLFFM